MRILEIRQPNVVHLQTLLSERIKDTMKWTNTKPTKPGWYWCWETHVGVYMFKLHNRHERDVLYTDEVGEYDRPVNSITFRYAQWMGPVDEPEAP